uniref:RHS repeat-associated core domain-containing protein n=1 Tax=Streptomyces sp. NRRL F-2664 TaxID=1463842 RepID=UPI0018FE3A5A
ARLYHPETGRFTTRDPHPTPLNKYQAYAANPIEHTDPTGNITLRIRRQHGLHVEDPEVYAIDRVPGSAKHAEKGSKESSIGSEASRLQLPTSAAALREAGGSPFYRVFGVESSFIYDRAAAAHKKIRNLSEDDRNHALLFWVKFDIEQALTDLGIMSVLSRALDERVTDVLVADIRQTANEFQKTVRRMNENHEHSSSEKPEWLTSLNVIANSGVVRSMTRVKKEDFLNT